MILKSFYLSLALSAPTYDVLSPPVKGAAQARLGARGQDGDNVLKASRVGRPEDQTEASVRASLVWFPRVFPLPSPAMLKCYVHHGYNRK